MAILADTAGQAGVGPAMGFTGMSIALGVLIGPVVGGVLYHKYGYLAVFVSGYAVCGLFPAVIHLTAPLLAVFLRLDVS